MTQCVQARTRILGGVIAGALLLVVAGAANATPLLTFGFTDLSGDYTAVSGTFAAHANSLTDGDVTRMLPVETTALYTHDFTATTAGYTMTMNVTSITPFTAVGTGTLTIADDDGDALIASMAGTWLKNGQFAFFNGTLGDVTLVRGGDGTFRGPSGGEFDLDFSAYGPGPYEGAIMTLQTGKWFDSGSWTGQNTLVQGAVTPEPASAALAVLGLVLGGTLRPRRTR